MDAWLYNSISFLVLLNLMLSLRNIYNLNECRDLLYHVLDHLCPIDEYGEKTHNDVSFESENSQIIVFNFDDSESDEKDMSWEEWERE